MSTTRTALKRFQAYCIGTGKTGTHSIAGIFEKNFRAAHEPESELLISIFFDLVEGRKTPEAIRSFLRTRDERLSLELESDGTLYCFLDFLLEEFPEAKFLLTIRDCYSWLDSVLNHNLARRPDGFWRRFDDSTFAPWHFEHTTEEKHLSEHGLRTLGHYFNHWATHNQTVIAKVPEQRLIVVRTDRIRESIAQIGVFLGIPSQDLDLTNSHMFKNSQKFNLVSRIDRVFLEDSVRRYCRPLMKMYFPEIESYDDISPDTDGTDKART